MTEPSPTEILAREVKGWADSREGWNAYQHEMGYRVVSELRRLSTALTTAQAERDVPSVTEWSTLVANERARQIGRGYTPEHDREHGYDHVSNWAIDYARRGKAVESAAMQAAARNVHEAEVAALTTALAEARAALTKAEERAAAPTRVTYSARQTGKTPPTVKAIVSAANEAGVELSVVYPGDAAALTKARTDAHREAIVDAVTYLEAFGRKDAADSIRNLQPRALAVPGPETKPEAGRG